MGTDLAAKRLELLTELVPGLHRLAVLWNPGRPGFASQIQQIHTASASRGLSLDVLQVRSPPEFDHAFRTMGDTGVGGAIILDDAMFHQERTRLTTLAAPRRRTGYRDRDRSRSGRPSQREPRRVAASDGCRFRRLHGGTEHTH